ncbi:hypothetical protein [Prosthecobacter vanneervenii]|uniref:Uncharacterized protein n=1 Tax=Prosthecobacter vanneervenii TaxID=48466 RepID=A0A7W8DIK1_9BACT|nr:hypothetical protein [Prosthecobacter vanneervenii]MBB5030861.1 hypothetical protein [Prosthecobacter vanneervenii]
MPSPPFEQAPFVQMTQEKVLSLLIADGSSCYGVVSKERCRVILREFEESVKSNKSDWMTPTSILAGLIVFFLSSEIKKTVWGGPELWFNVLLICLGMCIFWLIIAIKRAVRFKAVEITVEEAVNSIFKDASVLTRHASGNVGFQVVSKKGLDEIVG